MTTWKIYQPKLPRLLDHTGTSARLYNASRFMRDSRRTAERLIIIRMCLGIHNVTDYRRLRPGYFCTPGGESERDYATIISLRVDLCEYFVSLGRVIFRESEKQFQETFIEITDETDREVSSRISTNFIPTLTDQKRRRRRTRIPLTLSPAYEDIRLCDT